MQELDAEVRVAIIDAVDHYLIAAREVGNRYETRELVGRMMHNAGREDELEDEVFPSGASVAAAVFLRSLKQNGYELVRVSA